MSEDSTPAAGQHPPSGPPVEGALAAGAQPFWRNSAAATLQVDPHSGPDLKRAIPATILTVIALFIGVRLDGPTPDGPQSFDVFGWQFTLPPGWISLLDIVCLVVFVLAGAFAARSASRVLQRVAGRRAGPAAGQAVRLLCTIGAAIAIVTGVFAILQLDLRSLLLGSAVTGIIIGIAAQQTLNNFFAGLVLFFARPYVAGQRVKIRAGSMGGPFTGVIVGAGMMYTVIDTDDEGLISMPNAGLMSAAIGPAPATVEPEPSDDRDCKGGTPDDPDSEADRSGGDSDSDSTAGRIGI
jgi:small-conductance mechanosensitive channel